MDPHNPAKRQRPATARQRRPPTTSLARMRHTPPPVGGGVSADQRSASEAPQNAADESASQRSETRRERIHSGALAAMSAMNERMRLVTQLSRKGKDPLAHPTTWIVEPSLYERLHGLLANVVPFGLRERARSRGFWRRRALPLFAILASVVVAFGVGLLALNAAGHAAGAFSTTTTAQATTGGSVMISPLNTSDSTPTPAAQQYSVGVWVSNTLPQGGSVTVFVRVSNNSLPQPNARVFIHADTPNGGFNIGPLTTGSYGIVSAQLDYGNVGGQQPIFLTASTSIGGKTFSGQYTFVTYGGVGVLATP